MGYIDILVPTSDSDGQIVRIICTHFDHCGIDQVIQQQEQNVVTQAGLNNPEYPTILMGDLNVGWGTNVLPEFRNLGDHIGVSWVDLPPMARHRSPTMTRSQPPWYLNSSSSNSQKSKI